MRERFDQNAGGHPHQGRHLSHPLNEPCKTGSDLAEDFQPLLGCRTGITPATCGPTDGFDDTFAIFTKGLAEGPPSAC
jgi:hypothetical protein